MLSPILSVRHLQISFQEADTLLSAVSGISFDIFPGEILALLGESGCGKSLTALAILQLLPVNAYYHHDSKILFHGADLLEYSPHQMRGVRGCKIAMIFQEPMTSLNPVLTVAQQIAEVLIQHKGIKGKALKQQIMDLLEQVGIDDAARCYAAFPHQLSGGQKQRVMIAMAIATGPDLLIADEPTTALDVTIQAQILDLLTSLQRQLDMAMLLITHDLGVVHLVASRVAVMYAGQLVETATKQDFFEHPLHPYSRKLFDSLPGLSKRHQPLDCIKGSVPPLKPRWETCRFAARCPSYLQSCDRSAPELLAVTPSHQVRCHRVAQLSPYVFEQHHAPLEPTLTGMQTPQQAVLQVTDLKIYFSKNQGMWRRRNDVVKAVDGISFELFPGETLAVVGESGCGKTTTGRGLLQLVPITHGKITFKQQNLLTLHGKNLHQLRKQMQIIFQDPFASMDPRMTVGDIIMEGMVAHRLYPHAVARQNRVIELLEQVGLSQESYHRYPHQFSGGQRQRISIARALAVEPEIIICDEPTSALDVSVQAQVINLLQRLQQELQLSYIFISHNIAVVGHIADRILVMYAGKIIEAGDAMAVLHSPQHPYTKKLLAAVPLT